MTVEPGVRPDYASAVMTDASEDLAETPERRGGRALRGVWWVISVLAAVLLLVLVAAASTAILSPDAFVDSCNRTQLVTPMGCESDTFVTTPPAGPSG